MLRPATMKDAAILYAWRKQAEQADFWEGVPLEPTQHLAWLRQRLNGSLVRILIWQHADKEPTGMIRIDSNGEACFYAADDETALAMLKSATRYVSDYGGRLKASVDEADTRTWQLLERAGFVTQTGVRFLLYR